MKLEIPIIPVLEASSMAEWLSGRRSGKSFKLVECSWNVRVVMRMTRSFLCLRKRSGDEENWGLIRTTVRMRMERKRRNNVLCPSLRYSGKDQKMGMQRESAQLVKNSIGHAPRRKTS